LDARSWFTLDGMDDAGLQGWELEANGDCGRISESESSHPSLERVPAGPLAHPCRELGEALEQQRATSEVLRVIFWSSEPARARIEVTGSQFLPNFGRT
jgi:hypothetical protein